MAAQTLYELISSLSNGTQNTNNAQNQKEKHRELILQAQPNSNTAFLKFIDEQFTWYNIPLGETAITKKNDPTKNENILVPVIPLCYTTPDLNPNKADKPREGGYIYIYIGDYLWRELEVLKNGYYRDINLHKYHGKDIRPSKVERDNRILLPFKVKNTENTISMCYSEIQWSWVRINSMGGMDKKDFRINDKYPPKFANDVGISKKQAAKNRRLRMQEIDVSQFKKGFPPTIANGKKARIESIGNVSSKLYFLKLHRKSDIPAIYLHDSLGIANNINNDLDIVISFLENIVKNISAEKYFKSAILAYHTFFNDDLWEKIEDNSSPIAQNEITDADDNSTDIFATRNSNARNLRKSSKSIDKIHLEKLLKVDLRKKIRKEIRKLKNRYVEFVNGKFNGKEITIKNNDFISINEVLKDYAELEAPSYGLLWQTFLALIHIMPYDPNVLDRTLDVAINHDKVNHDNDLGHIYLKSILTPEHPLHTILFPTKIQVNEYLNSYILDRSKIEIVDGSGKFRPVAYAKIFELTQTSVSNSLMIDDSLKKFQNTIANFSMIMATQVYDVSSKQTKKLTINPVTRLTIALNDPNLKSLHLINKGADISTKLVLNGRLSIFEKLNQSHKSIKLSKATSNPGIKSDKVNVLSPLTQKPIGSMPLEQIAGNKGIPEGYDLQVWNSIFVKTDQSGTTPDENLINGTSKLPSLSVLEKSSKAADKILKDISKFTSKATAGKIPFSVKAYNSKTVPVMISVAIGINILSAYHSLWNAKTVNKKVKHSVKTILAATALPFSIMEVTKHMSGTDKAIQIWGKRFEKGFALKKLKAKKLATKLFRGYGPVKIAGFNTFKSSSFTTMQAAEGLKIASTTFAITGTLMSLYEMIDAFMNDDDDAAIAYGVQMLAGIVYALNAAAGAGSSALIVSLFAATPWGWAALIVIIISGITASMLSHTKLEKWAKHGPFAKIIKDRMTGEYSVPPDKFARHAYETLLALLMEPKIRIKDDENRNSVYVDVIAPGFEVGKNVLTIHSRYSETSSQQKPMNLLSWVPLIDKKYPLKTIGLRYIYERPSFNIQVKIFARVQHITKDGYFIPMKPDKNIGKTADPKLIDDKINGWAYAKPIKIINTPEENPDIEWGL
ncbi:MAG: hypothetical protein ACC657_11245 [Thiohalomonadales bacterium]